MIYKIYDFLIELFYSTFNVHKNIYVQTNNRETRRKKIRGGHNKKMTLGNYSNSSLFKREIFKGVVNETCRNFR